MNMYVGNLNYQIAEEDLREMFEEYGEVKSVKMIMDRDTGRSKGFAFVEMYEKHDAQIAMDELNGAVIDGKPLKVNAARRKDDHRDSRGGGGYGRDRGGYGRDRDHRSSYRDRDHRSSYRDRGDRDYRDRDRDRDRGDRDYRDRDRDRDRGDRDRGDRDRGDRDRDRGDRDRDRGDRDRDRGDRDRDRDFRR